MKILLTIAMALGIAAAADAAGQNPDGPGRHRHGQADAQRDEPAQEAPRGGPGMGGRMRELRDVFHALLTDHDQIKRAVRKIPGGVVTVTTSDDPRIARLIQKHVRQMKEHLEAGRPIRMWDPLFVEIVRHADKIEMEIEDLPDGVRVTETSDDPQVALLIRQHAIRGVSEFVRDGFDRAHEETPLPKGYRGDRDR